jgi:chromosome segregation ATPase
VSEFVSAEEACALLETENERLEAEVGRLRQELAGCEQEKALAVGAARGAGTEVERLSEIEKRARALLNEAPLEEWDGGSLGYLAAELLDALAGRENP